MKLNEYVTLMLNMVFLKILASSDVNRSSRKICHWEPFLTPSKAVCVKRCLLYKGFVHPITQQLFCFYSSAPAEYKLVQQDSEEKTLPYCECMRVTFNKNGVQTFNSCDPAITDYSVVTKGGCAKMCRNYYIYKTGRNKNDFFCMESFYNTISKTLETTDELMVHRKVTEKPVSYGGYYCQCGSDLNVPEIAQNVNPIKLDKKLKNSIEDDFVASCSAGQFDTYDIKGCEEACADAKGYFPPNDNQLICFNREMPASRVNSKIYDCDCGTTLSGSHHSCVPTHRYDVSSLKECFGKCRRITVFVATTAIGKGIVHCELTENVKNVIEKLDWKIGPRKTYTTSGGYINSKHGCECGMKTTFIDLNKNISEHATTTRFLLNCGINASNSESVNELIAESSLNRLNISENRISGSTCNESFEETRQMATKNRTMNSQSSQLQIQSENPISTEMHLENQRSVTHSQPLKNKRMLQMSKIQRQNFHGINTMKDQLKQPSVGEIESSSYSQFDNASEKPRSYKKGHDLSPKNKSLPEKSSYSEHASNPKEKKLKKMVK